MKKILVVLICTLVMTGCSSNKINENIADENSEEWTYEKIENEFGGIVEMDCVSVRDCLNELSWEDYDVIGYIVSSTKSYIDENTIMLTISDSMDERTKYKTIITSTEDGLDFKNGDMVYISGEVSYNREQEYLYLFGNVSKSREEGKEYMSVNDFSNLMQKIYNDTYFKAQGIIMKDGENFDGTPKYYLYPSEEAYKEDKLTRVEIEFSEYQSNISGKDVVVMGNPDGDSSNQKLCNCSIIE